MILKFKIEKNVPLPPRGSYPFASMAVNDSFFFPTDDAGLIRSVASAHGRRHKKQFVVRKIEEKGIVGVRIWRVK